jgi:transcriptional regulator with XRE-family HTH domain
MDSGQLRTLLKQYNLSQRGAAKALGINERTMRRYVSGEGSVRKVVELALLGMRKKDMTTGETAMTRDDIIRLALDAHLLNYVDLETPRRYFICADAGVEEVERFAALVAAAEREACAKVMCQVEQARR